MNQLLSHSSELFVRIRAGAGGPDAKWRWIWVPHTSGLRVGLLNLVLPAETSRRGPVDEHHRRGAPHDSIRLRHRRKPHLNHRHEQQPDGVHL